jgi:hypothetical protein
MYHVMSRGDQREDIFLNDVDRHDFIKTARLQWSPQDQVMRQKSYPAKLALAARLRQETTLSVKQIAERLPLGRPKGARATLHKFQKGSPAELSQVQLQI